MIKNGYSKFFLQENKVPRIKKIKQYFFILR